MMSENHLTPNHQYKDRLFRFIFQDKRDLLSLYNAMNGSSYGDPDELEIRTLEDFIYLGMKNDVAFIIDNRIALYEEQSSWNPNMPLRGLFYFSKLYQGYISDHQLNVHSSSRVKLPFPQYIVFYIGQDRKITRRTLRLSDSFLPIDGQKPCLECIADVINIRTGVNDDLVKSCRKLYEYSYLVCSVQDFITQGYPLSQAIDMAIELCIQQDVMADFLIRYRTEVADMIFSKYNEEFHLMAIQKESREEGREEGEQRINHLNSELIRLNRFEDLKRATNDPEFQKQLLEEFHIE